MKRITALLAACILFALSSLAASVGQGHKRQPAAEALCERARQESKNMQRYAESDYFETATVRQLGRQLRDRLAAMDREHARLQERLTPEQRERNEKRLAAMNRCQQRWQEALSVIEQELQGPVPNRAELRRRARAIEKAIKKYQKERGRVEGPPRS